MIAGNFPYEPLARVVGEVFYPHTLGATTLEVPQHFTRVGVTEWRPMSERLVISELVGVTRRSVDRWAHVGIEPWMADRAAIALGLHPSAVWPAEYSAWLELALIEHPEQLELAV